MPCQAARLAVSFALFTLFTQVAVADPPAESAVRDTVSIGTAMDGILEQGQVLPKRGTGYRLRRETLERRARFGTSELIALIEEAAHRVNKVKAGSTLVVGDLSVSRGGDLDHHGSHCSGRDVDFLFYTRDRGGKAVVNGDFVAMDGNGFSTDPPLALRFDVERNWALVEALLLSKKAKVQWIFVADKLRALLLAYAEDAGRPPMILNMARQMLKQPGFKAHVDHFHVRIYCASADKPRCIDTGPRWAWAR